MTQFPISLGIDIGGTKIAVGLVSASGRVLARAQAPTNATEGGQAVLARAITLAAQIQANYPAYQVSGIGVGAGGCIDADTGVVVSASDILPGWAGIQIVSGLRDRFGVPIAADNDVNALAVGECRFGAGRGLGTVVFLALGTGVGGALVLDGRIYHGAHWGGGEFGHLLIENGPAARRDAGGDTGTLEAYVSGGGLVQTYCELIGDSALALRGEEIAAMALDEPGGLAARAIEITGEHLGFGLASLANILDPDLFVIGGGLASLVDRLLDPARRVLRERAMSGPGRCPVACAALGSDAAVIGAASLVMAR